MDNKTEYRDLNMTPREIVEELDRHIIGQKAAKRPAQPLAPPPDSGADAQ